MLSYPFQIDSVAYPHIHVTSLKRSFQVLDNQNAGRVMSGMMERDIIGTYYNYSITVDADQGWLQEYDALYEVISSPSDYHTVIVPYGQSIMTFHAYITNGSDELDFMGNTKNYWTGLSFNFIAMAPQKSRV